MSANAGYARIAAVRIVKRGLDVFLSGISLVLLAPALVFIALAIRASGTGPVLVVRERLVHRTDSYLY
jgi:lipopolysaccharide/colanic/teichoic acid biosynthesis glycosyltransferase